MRAYTTYGSVRGTCGHTHRSIRTAAECANRDMAACNSLPGGNSYSDRTVYEIADRDGQWTPGRGLRRIADEDAAQLVDHYENGQ